MPAIGHRQDGPGEKKPRGIAAEKLWLAGGGVLPIAAARAPARMEGSGNLLWISSCRDEQRLCRTGRFAVSLFPILERGNGNADHVGELFLRHAQAGPNHSRVIFRQDSAPPTFQRPIAHSLGLAQARREVLEQAGFHHGSTTHTLSLTDWPQRDSFLRKQAPCLNLGCLCSPASARGSVPTFRSPRRSLAMIARRHPTGRPRG